ncbi:MAG: B12-binding domain-containing radical SAM protein [Candidatus Thermoplasmatota archaeon]|nr:B12-binding domain-containing radical SAM protein [Candidatus Thermoplasmatota archaeon]
MTKYVLLSDPTLCYSYRNFPLLDFLPCAPSNTMPRAIYDFLKGEYIEPLPSGRMKYAPYALRKLEAALLQRNTEAQVAVAHQNFLDRFITEDTEIIAVSTMDPLGTGPLTTSYSVLFGSSYYPWVRKEWESFMVRLENARKRSRAKLVVGGPGVWEFTLFPEELERFSIDYAYQGECEDVICDLFEQIHDGSLDRNMFAEGYTSFDGEFRREFRSHQHFVSRRPGRKSYPSVDEIPAIHGPAAKGIVEIMRGCGIGCDFCEVTLRPLRYYPIDRIVKETEVNVRQGGFSNAWLQTDEIFAFRHGRMYEPNQDALLELFSSIMSVPGVKATNPTHGRISIPAGYPELISRLSEIGRAGPDNWIGVQVGIETGSERLAAIHMPNKTLPLKIGADGSWQDIVWWGVHNFNRYYWRPAFTCQVGQREETDEDNWETVELINRLSSSQVDGRPFEFTVTPMQNVPLGHIKSRDFHNVGLSKSQLAVYYASYRHLAKMAMRNSAKAGTGGFLTRAGTGLLIPFGGWLMLKGIERMCRKMGLDVEKVKRHGIALERRSRSTLPSRI